MKKYRLIRKENNVCKVRNNESLNESEYVDMQTVKEGVELGLVDINFTLLEKVKDIYVVQEDISKGILLFDETKYNDYKYMGIIKDCDLASEITRKLLTYKPDNSTLFEDGLEVFETNNYTIVYEGKNFGFVLYFITSYVNKKEVIIYIPKVINSIITGADNSFHSNKLTFIATGLTHSPHFENLHTSMLDLTYLDFSKFVNLAGMFSNNTYLKTVIFGDDIDTSNVTDMSYLFSLCSNLVSVDLSRFDTSKVTKMQDMFNGCRYLTDINLDNFNTKNVIFMDEMFFNCESLVSVNVSHFDTDKVSTMSHMFAGCIKLEDVDVSDWKLSNLRNAMNMFTNVRRIKGICFDNFINRFKTFKGVKNINYIFSADLIDRMILTDENKEILLKVFEEQFYR